jgi:hypothetical protein
VPLSGSFSLSNDGVIVALLESSSQKLVMVVQSAEVIESSKSSRTVSVAMIV